ncbi:MAG: DUF2313 domain-containing protein [Lachnospiraceae bacterium]|nr:DUF2313 domain-containing protein [Lachnospiraceae bacterium]
METNRFLIDYLPPIMRSYREMKHIMSAEQPEIDDVFVSAEQVLSNQFIMDADETGVKRWESNVGITPKDTDTLDERKFRVITKMNQQLPYTIKKLNEVLTTICGSGNFLIHPQVNEYHIEIKLALSNKNNYEEVVDVLTKMIPANLTQYVQIMYNTYEELKKYTHAELSEFTHYQLRNEVLSGDRNK